MPWLDARRTAEILRLAHLSDREIRSDLAIGEIRDEDDYTSNFTGALRRNINCYASHLRATSFLLPSRAERQTGTDATIIISNGRELKVVLFEAKWPRFSKTYDWDYPQTSSGLSHFSDQLQRQRRYATVCAVFEMFYCEWPFGLQPAWMCAETSTCVWHDHAIAFEAARVTPNAVWDQAEATALLRSQATTGILGIVDILGDVCACKVGVPIRSRSVRAIADEYRLSGHILAITAGDEPLPG